MAELLTVVKSTVSTDGSGPAGRREPSPFPVVLAGVAAFLG
ncbi:MAG: hypothetical protein ACXV2I_00850 [Actinomycetes bacterium]